MSIDGDEQVIRARFSSAIDIARALILSEAMEKEVGEMNVALKRAQLFWIGPDLHSYRIRGILVTDEIGPYRALGGKLFYYDLAIGPVGCGPLAADQQWSRLMGEASIQREAVFLDSNLLTDEIWRRCLSWYRVGEIQTIIQKVYPPKQEQLEEKYTRPFNLREKRRFPEGA